MEMVHNEENQQRVHLEELEPAVIEGRNEEEKKCYELP